MTKERFIILIDILIKYYEKEAEISHAFNNSLYLSDVKEISNIIDALLNIIKNEFKGDSENWIDYYIYELDCGKNWEPGTITINNKDIKLQTEEDLYNLLIDSYPDTQFDKLKKMDKKEFANYIESVFIAGKISNNSEIYENYEDWLDSEIK